MGDPSGRRCPRTPSPKTMPSSPSCMATGSAGSAASRSARMVHSRQVPPSTLRASAHHRRWRLREGRARDRETSCNTYADDIDEQAARREGGGRGPLDDEGIDAVAGACRRSTVTAARSSSDEGTNSSAKRCRVPGTGVPVTMAPGRTVYCASTGRCCTTSSALSSNACSSGASSKAPRTRRTRSQKSGAATTPTVVATCADGSSSRTMPSSVSDRVSSIACAAFNGCHPPGAEELPLESSGVVEAGTRCLGLMRYGGRAPRRIRARRRSHRDHRRTRDRVGDRDGNPRGRDCSRRDAPSPRRGSPGVHASRHPPLAPTETVTPTGRANRARCRVRSRQWQMHR